MVILAGIGRRGTADICRGPLLINILRFSVPIILSGVLQMLFNSADTAVVGHFGNPTAMASVGSTASLTHLIVNLFLGMSVGAGVVVAQGIGAEKHDAVQRTIHTSAVLSVLCGVVVAVIGILFSPTFLRWMGSPADVIDGAALYMRIYFAGMPAIMLYNFGSSILRSMGDTKRPLYFLVCAGVINVVLNLIFVIVFKLDVAGVALATVISQCGAAVLVVLCLMRLPADIRLDLRHLHPSRKYLMLIMAIGLPAGLQSCLFSFSNVILQSSVNSFGSVAVSANAAVSNIDNIIYIAMNGVSQSVTTFAGQNYGAHNIRRVGRSMLDASLVSTIIGMLLGIIACLLDTQLLSIFTNDPAVIEMSLDRLFITASTYFLCGLMETFSGTLRGMGRSFLPMVVSLLGACGLRLLWIFTIFPYHRTLDFLYLSYPLSWGITASVHLLFCLIVLKKEHNKQDVHSDLPDMRERTA